MHVVTHHGQEELQPPVQVAIPDYRVGNKQKLMGLLYKDLTKVDVEFAFSVYEYDPVEKKYYKCMLPGDDATLEGILEKNGSDLNLAVADDASREVQSPENYSVQMGVKPQPSPRPSPWPPRSRTRWSSCGIWRSAEHRGGARRGFVSGRSGSSRVSSTCSSRSHQVTRHEQRKAGTGSMEHGPGPSGASWDQVRRDFLALAGLCAPSGVDWLFRHVFPELDVLVRRGTAAHAMPSDGVRIGSARLGGCAFGSRSLVPVRDLHVTLRCRESLSPAGVPWLHEAQARLRAQVFPALSTSRLHLPVALLLCDDSMVAQLAAESPVGYAPLPGGEGTARYIEIFRGQVPGEAGAT